MYDLWRFIASIDCESCYDSKGCIVKETTTSILETAIYRDISDDNTEKYGYFVIRPLYSLFLIQYNNSSSPCLLIRFLHGPIGYCNNSINNKIDVNHDYYGIQTS